MKMLLVMLFGLIPLMGYPAMADDDDECNLTCPPVACSPVTCPPATCACEGDEAVTCSCNMTCEACEICASCPPEDESLGRVLDILEQKCGRLKFRLKRQKLTIWCRDIDPAAVE